MSKALYGIGMMVLILGPFMLHVMGVTALRDTLIITTWAVIYGACMAGSEFVKKL